MQAAADLSMLWADLPYLDRFDAAARAGFKGVEVPFPYDVPAKDTQRALGRGGLELTCIAAPPPNYTGGARGFAAQPENTARFQTDMKRAFRFAQAVGVPMIHVMAGEASGAGVTDTLLSNLRWASEAAPKGVTLLLNPVCDAVRPGNGLASYDQAAQILTHLKAPNIGLQFDSHHAQMIHGDAVDVFNAHARFVRHIRIGDAPTRAEPGQGAVDFAALFKAIKRQKYKGWISGAYHPSEQASKTLGWMGFDLA